MIFLLSLFLSDVKIFGANLLSKKVAYREIPWGKGDVLPQGFEERIKKNLDELGLFKKIEVYADTFLDSVDVVIYLDSKNPIYPWCKVSWNRDVGLMLDIGAKISPIYFSHGEIFLVYHMRGDSGYRIGGRVIGTSSHPIGGGVSWVRHSYFDRFLGRWVRNDILHIESSIYKGPSLIFEYVNNLYLIGVMYKDDFMGIKIGGIKDNINASILGGYVSRKIGRWRIRIGGDASFLDTLPCFLKFRLGDGKGMRSRIVGVGDMRYYINLEYEVLRKDGWLKSIATFIDLGNVSPSFPHFSTGFTIGLDIWFIKDIELAFFWDGKFGCVIGSLSELYLGLFHFHD